MGFLKTIVSIGAPISLLLAIVTGITWHILSKPVIPETFTELYWGRGEPKPDDSAIVPFQINVSNAVLIDLQERLKNTPSLTPPLEDTNFQYGFNSDYLQKLVQFWFKEYKWKERQVYLNKYPQFKTQVAGLNIHFIHVKPSKIPEGVQVLPLLLLHGWPTSVVEFYDVIPLLTIPRDDEKFVFEIVVPSLPGFGFSDGASKKGFGPAQIAVVMKTFMNKLGFKKYYIQGGDWGAIIGNYLSILFPERVLGFHSNFCFTNEPTAILKGIAARIFPQFFLTDIEKSRLRNYREQIPFLMEESGYFHIQATKPDTIGLVLSCSPAGLAAYVLEKYSVGTNPEWRSLSDGGLTKKYTLTKLLDNIMIYWISGSMTTAMRLYREGFNNFELQRAQRTVPTACARFLHEIDYVPEFILRDRYVNLVHVSDFQGGHFAAFEEPKLLSEDIWKAVNKMQKFHSRT